jgi:hypothetical protein
VVFFVIAQLFHILLGCFSQILQVNVFLLLLFVLHALILQIDLVDSLGRLFTLAFLTLFFVILEFAALCLFGLF